METPTKTYLSAVFIPSYELPKQVSASSDNEMVFKKKIVSSQNKDATTNLANIKTPAVNKSDHPTSYRKKRGLLRRIRLFHEKLNIQDNIDKHQSEKVKPRQRAASLPAKYEDLRLSNQEESKNINIIMVSCLNTLGFTFT